MEYPVDQYPELSSLPNLLKTEIEKGVEKSFRGYLEVFSNANNNPMQSCVYCYFVNAPEEYKRLVDYCAEHYNQTLLLLLKNYFHPDGLASAFPITNQFFSYS
ncbi:MAG: hypothetical protein HQ522_20595 [Bacteroidetes bacterium]|nr:hypothetical protein [Bacteroidota bacterium]